MIASHDGRPLLFLDVDGPLIPFRARPADRVAAGRVPAGRDATAPGNPLVDRLDPADGRKLLGLGCELVWATTWMTDANEVVAPRLGLPRFPVVEFPDDDEAPAHGLHWKTKFLIHWAAGRPFVWLDDEVGDADRRWVDAHHPARALVRRIDSFTGLTDADFAAVRRWLAAG